VRGRVIFGKPGHQESVEGAQFQGLHVLHLVEELVAKRPEEPLMPSSA
jgi:hypothetical protein